MESLTCSQGAEGTLHVERMGKAGHQKQPCLEPGEGFLEFLAFHTWMEHSTPGPAHVRVEEPIFSATCSPSAQGL